MELFVAQAGQARAIHGAVEVLLNLPQDLLAHQLGVPGQDEVALAGDIGHEALGDEVGVGARGGDDADAQVPGQGPDGGQHLVSLHLAGEDRIPDLLSDLLVDGHSRRVGQDDCERHSNSFRTCTL